MKVSARAPLILLLPAVAAAALRAGRLYRRRPFDQACRELASAPPLPPALRDPKTCLRLVNRLLPLLPPRGLRPCLKRSLLLLDLWSRCGLAPRLHLGVNTTGEGRDGHAWVSAPGRPELSAPEPGYTEVFVWGARASGENPDSPSSA